MGSASIQTPGDGSALEQRVAAFRHPHLVALAPSGAWYTLDRRAGVSLADLQASAQPPETRITLRLLLDALSGLDAVHHIDGEGGPGPYVHGELSPATIIAGRDGVGRLIAVPTRRLVGAALHDARGYLAPEKLLGDKIDQRADVFSVGVLLWEAIAGRRLFADGSADAVVTQLVGGKTPPLVCSPEAAWAAPLESVVQRALAVDPAERWHNVRAMAARAENVARGHLAPIAQVAVLVALQRDALDGGAGGASRSSLPPPKAQGPSPSAAPVASDSRSPQPEDDRALREPPPIGQIAWEHVGSARPNRHASMPSTHGHRHGKLVASALAASFLIAAVSGYLLLFRGTSDTASSQGAVLVTRQVAAPSAAALALPAPPPLSPPRPTVPSSAPPTRDTTGAVSAITKAGVAPPPPPLAQRAPTQQAPPKTAPAARSPAPEPTTPRPAPKPKLDPKEVFGI